MEWFDDLSGENEEDIATEVADLMDKAGEFYDAEMKEFEQIIKLEFKFHSFVIINS